jgi:hypothetical protein
MVLDWRLNRSPKLEAGHEGRRERDKPRAVVGRFDEPLRWHKAEITIAPMNVRFREKSGHRLDIA